MVKKDIYSNYYGLLFDCPMGKPVEGCVFREIREMTISERLEYLKNVDPEIKAELIQKHQACLAKREEKIPYSRIAVL
ncbi:hypothetical protein EYV94_09015 [Puteibacter caeruleilacunae]|nr:hypothetical protein EYV94_09015 [Puteibacter caeruleilacunae]